MSIESVRNNIKSLNSTITSLESKLTRLQTAKTEAIGLKDAISSYRKQCNNHKDSINSFWSFSWEGQTVTDFKKLYDGAIFDLDSEVIGGYTTIINDLDDLINHTSVSITNNKNQRSYWQTQLEQLLSQQQT